MTVHFGGRCRRLGTGGRRINSHVGFVAMRRHRNVGRVDREHFHGWVVVMKRRGRNVGGEHFRDALYGGRMKALRAAIARRDELEAELPPATHLRERDSRSKTGMAGVTVVMRRRRKRVLRYWLANWVELEGRRVQRSFSVSKYGEGRARDLAVGARREAVERILGQRGARVWWQRD